ncbi:MAG: AarF/ABC1/UbiB kinase family protein [Planctomycetaceae bacterium]
MCEATKLPRGRRTPPPHFPASAASPGLRLDVHPLRYLRHLGRVRQITAVLVTHGFGDLIERLGLRKYVDWGKRSLLRQPSDSPHTTAERVRRAFEQLGPTYIKLGQVLSTRPDLLPIDWIEELSMLQERVPTFPGAEAIEVVERELRKPLPRLFTEFDPEPLAAGSLGQVHRARHPDGTLLAVKVRRPHAVEDIERDLSLLAEAAPLLAALPQFAPFDPVGIVQHFTRVIRRELNFRREGRTIEEFRKLFRKDATLFVPRVDEDLTTDAVLTMEYVEGIRADDKASLVDLGISPSRIASNGAHIYMKQVFEFGIFHGDPHPGNVRIRCDGGIALLDYGMIGYLRDDLRDQLVDLFVAVVRNQVDDVTELVRQLGHPMLPIDDVLLRADVHDLLDRFVGIPLADLKVAELLTGFTNLLSQHALRCPADLMLLIRTLVTLEGLGRQLDPEFNLARELSPFIESVFRKRYDPRRMLSRAWSDLGDLARAAHDLPLSLNRTLQKLSQDDLKFQLEHRGIDRLINEFDRSSNRIVVGLVTAALIVASALVIRAGTTSAWIVAPIFLLSGFLGVWLIYGILRSGRL